LHAVALLRDVWKYVLHGVNMSFEEGCYVLWGPNGAGKTTVLKLLAGVIAPERGVVRVLGGDPFRNYKIRGMINYVASMPLADRFETPLDYLGLYSVFTPSPLRGASPKRAMRILGLDGLAERRIVELSDGQRKRVELAKLLVKKGVVTLVDEPLAHLDASSRSMVIDLLRDACRQSRLTVVVSHDPGLEGELGAKVVELRDGLAGNRQALGSVTVNVVLKARHLNELGKALSLEGVVIRSFNVDKEDLAALLGLRPEDVRDVLVVPARQGIHDATVMEFMHLPRPLRITIRALVDPDVLPEFLSLVASSGTVIRLNVESHGE